MKNRNPTQNRAVHSYRPPGQGEVRFPGSGLVLHIAGASTGECPSSMHPGTCWVFLQGHSRRVNWDKEAEPREGLVLHSLRRKQNKTLAEAGSNEPQNPRMAWIRRNLTDHLVPTPATNNNSPAAPSTQGWGRGRMEVMGRQRGEKMRLAGCIPEGAPGFCCWCLEHVNFNRSRGKTSAICKEN